MAIKYLCDRCMREIPNREDIVRLRIVRPLERPDTVVIDLCPDCDRELKAFIATPINKA